MLAYVNGELVPEAQASISVYDSGFHYADGVFEGLRVYAGQVFRLEEHVDRLFRSARALDIAIGMSRARLGDEIRRWQRANELHEDVHVKVIVTRGNRNPPRMNPTFVAGGPNIVFVGGAAGPASRAGMRVMISSVRRTCAEAFDPRIKSLGYGNNLLARLEAFRLGMDDALMLDQQGFLAEATGSNVFLVRDGVLYTPWPRARLEGITQCIVMELAAELGHRVECRDMAWADIAGAGEIFATGTAMEIAPIVAVNGMAVGTGECGPITAALMDRYAHLVRAEGAVAGGGAR